MTFLEAKKILVVWRKWYWPTHFALEAVLPKIPKSFLPYPEEVLEETINIIAKYYLDKGDQKTSKRIQESFASIIGKYSDDEEALLEASKTFSNPVMREAVHIFIANYKRDFDEWKNKDVKTITK